MESNIICGIYKITSLKKRIYVGESIDIERRKGEYGRLYNCKGQIKLYNSLKKYGWEAHKFEIIHLCKEKLLNELEMYYIKLFGTFNTPHGLNLTKGGEGIFGHKHTEESNTKRSKSLKGKYTGKNSFCYGKTHTKEHNQNISKIMSGKNGFWYGKVGPNSGKVSPMKGKTWEEIHGTEKAKKIRNKNRQSHLGKIFPNGYKKRLFKTEEIVVN